MIAVGGAINVYVTSSLCGGQKPLAALVIRNVIIPPAGTNVFAVVLVLFGFTIVAIPVTTLQVIAGNGGDEGFSITLPLSVTLPAVLHTF
jgi:hypothetical protein